MSPPITFADARRIVRDHLLDSWTAADGQLSIADYGYENPTHWQVIARSSDPGGDDDPGGDGDPVYVGRPDKSFLVSKDNGDVEPIAGNAERLSGMTPYGEVPSG